MCTWYLLISVAVCLSINQILLIQSLSLMIFSLKIRCIQKTRLKIIVKKLLLTSFSEKNPPFGKARKIFWKCLALLSCWFFLPTAMYAFWVSFEYNLSMSHNFFIKTPNEITCSFKVLIYVILSGTPLHPHHFVTFHAVTDGLCISFIYSVKTSPLSFPAAICKKLSK